jgi:hypothetical protein
MLIRHRATRLDCYEPEPRRRPRPDWDFPPARQLPWLFPEPSDWLVFTLFLLVVLVTALLQVL